LQKWSISKFVSFANMNVIERLMVNYDTPRQTVNFIMTFLIFVLIRQSHMRLFLSCMFSVLSLKMKVVILLFVDAVERRNSLACETALDTLVNSLNTSHLVTLRHMVCHLRVACSRAGSDSATDQISEVFQDILLRPPWSSVMYGLFV